MIEQAIFADLERIEHGQVPPELPGVNGSSDLADAASVENDDEDAPTPFLEVAQSVQPQSVLRAAITAAYRRPELECVPFLIGQARLPASISAETEKQSVAAGGFADVDYDDEDYALERLLTEPSVSVNTAAAGGNANLMTIS